MLVDLTVDIANRGDGQGPYDLYNLSGTLITSDFIDPTTVAGFTGITTGVTFLLLFGTGLTGLATLKRKLFAQPPASGN